MDRRNALQQIGALALLASPAGFAFGQPKDSFTILKNTVPPETAGKIEVLEFFHYGCSHCQAFDPFVSQWSSSLADDVAFMRVPVTWGKVLENLGRLYYTLLNAKRLDLHGKVFAAVQEERLSLDKPDTVREWAKANNLDVPVFMKLYESPGIVIQAQRAVRLTKAYKIDSVPMLAVAGRFTTSPGMAGNSHSATLKVVDSLIERARKGG